MRGAGLREQPEGMRPERQAYGDVPQDGRQPEAPRQGDDEHRGGEQQDDER